MLTQISWVEKYLKGERIFTPETPKVGQKQLDAMAKAEFEKQIKSITPVKVVPTFKSQPKSQTIIAK